MSPQFSENLGFCDNCHPNMTEGYAVSVIALRLIEATRALPQLLQPALAVVFVRQKYQI